MPTKENVLIYYDAVNSAVCIAERSPTGQIQKIPVDASLISRGEYIAAFTAALQTLSKEADPLTADFVLPHRMYGIDYITLPLIKRSQLGEAFKTELRSLYKNYDELSFARTEVFTGKTSTTFCVAMVQKRILTELKAVFAKANITVEQFWPYGSALLAGAIKLNPSMKKAPCILLHTEAGHAYIAAYGKETLLGGIDIPFGIEALSDRRVSSERLLYHPDSAELLVINAKERAKATKLTMAINIEEEKIDDKVLNDESDEAIEANPELPDITKLGDETTEAGSSSDTSVSGDFFPGDDEEGSDILPEVKIKTLRKSAVRTFPKFMLREAPTTPQGFITENFRLFERRILMTIREMSFNEYMPKPEAIFLSLPPECAFLADVMAERNSEYKWFNLMDTTKAPSGLMLCGSGGPMSGKLPVFL